MTKEQKIKSKDLTTLPNCFITEQGILNILLTNPSLIQKTMSKIKKQIFYYEAHRILYELLFELSEKEKVINLTMIISNLQEKQVLEKIGGIRHLISIINRYENFTALEQYIEILTEKYIRRLIIEFGKQMIAWGYTTSIPLTEVMEKIEKAILQLNEQKTNEKIYSAAEIIDEIFLEMQAKANKTEKSNFKSSFLDLDSIIQGFEKSDLIIIAGRPSMGKTAFSLNLGKNIVEKYNIPLVIFTLEMSRQQILYRFLSTHSMISMNRLKNGKMTGVEWKNLSQAMRHISQLPIFIEDNPNISLLEIRTKIKKIFTDKTSTGLIIIDYLQLMKINSKLENRVQEISYITRMLKIMSKEFQIPIIVLSQLSRGLESRVNKRPMLSDLRESGCLNKFESVNEIRSWNTKKVCFSQSSFFEFKGFKPTYQVHFPKNWDIEMTSNHRILSKNGWIKVGQLQKNCEFYVPQNNEKENVQVKKLEYKGLNNVYEQTIPVYHNYFYKNVLLHNSIEQDADIVIMLYREDYYHEKKNKEQITELIVAKHRNGPVGTARLLFNPYITKFTSMERK